MMNSARRVCLKRIIAAGSLICSPSVSIAGVQTHPTDKTSELSRFRGHAFGAHWQLSLPRQTMPREALDGIVSVIDTVNHSMSPYIAESELSRFNRSRTQSEFSVSQELLTVLEAGLVIARATDGAFDPTVGPWVNRRGFGPIKGSLDSDYRDIVTGIDTVRKRRRDTTLDLCGIAKGYALDCITGLLQRQGFDHFLLEIGGELSARGQHPANRPWQVAIDLGKPTSTPSPSIRLHNRSVATSGTFYNGFDVAGSRVGHLISGSRQSADEGRLHSVTVMHESAMFADAWATALYVLGIRRGVQAASQFGLHSVFVGDASQQHVIVTTGDGDSALVEAV